MNICPDNKNTSRLYQNETSTRVLTLMRNLESHTSFASAYDSPRRGNSSYRLMGNALERLCWGKEEKSILPSQVVPPTPPAASHIITRLCGPDATVYHILHRHHHHLSLVRRCWILTEDRLLQGSRGSLHPNKPWNWKHKWLPATTCSMFVAIRRNSDVRRTGYISLPVMNTKWCRLLYTHWHVT